VISSGGVQQLIGLVMMAVSFRRGGSMRDEAGEQVGVLAGGEVAAGHVPGVTTWSWAPRCFGLPSAAVPAPLHRQARAR